MSAQRGHLLKRNYIFAVLILLVGFGGLLGYDLYFKPYVLSQTVVKVKVDGGGVLPKNHELQAGELYLDSVQTKDVPAGAVTEINLAERKITNVSLTDGSILTEGLVDLNDVEPRTDEGIFPVPKEAVYAINGSLRSRDKVDIYLVQEETKAGGGSNIAAGSVEGSPGGGQASMPEKAFLTGVTVNYVRTEDNNDVRDTELGNDNNRVTSTGKVAVPELKLKKSDGELLKQYLERGCKLWIVRVE
ncbi:hypothetical protein SAMN04487895_104184 [Paenibacillus sophorae]|uniref:SAF domain-containing protein n=1 Tax=Paenibacillus sophorae TaxID=1333845 RepID=A0A1H8L595_9BACL|nr:hypothetical protein [Paenibacillus sophorae]QWU17425.1 hypothetical protein KP014_09875 [Paenibacillus sophorae]SEO00303.1 hypothetical protein SAMN04487895_104184 [Paenibacillus sophorae]